MAMRDTPLRILHLTAGSDAGGVSRYLYDLCAATRAAGHEVAIAGERGAWHDLFQDADWPWLELPLKGGPLALWRATRSLRAYVREHRINLVHTHYRRATLVARRITGQPGIPILTTLHLTGLKLSGWNRLLSDFGDHTLAASDESRDWLIRQARVPAERISVIPHGVDVAKFALAGADEKLQARASLGLPADATIAAFVGRFDEPKNEQWMLDLAQASRKALPRVHIVMLGEGPGEAALRKRIARQDLGDCVKLLDYGDPMPVYRAADAVLLPSSQEGFSLVCAEAMSVGTPVLRTRTAGTSMMIRENQTGCSTPIDREAFVAAALAMLADRDHLAAMGRNAAALVRERLTFDRQVRDTLALYQQLIRPGSGPVPG